MGLLQLNDRRPGGFTPALIAFYETLAQHIGFGLQRMMAEEALRESEAKYRDLFQNMTEEVHFWQLVRGADGQSRPGGSSMPTHRL